MQTSLESSRTDLPRISEYLCARRIITVGALTLIYCGSHGVRANKHQRSLYHCVNITRRHMSTHNSRAAILACTLNGCGIERIVPRGGEWCRRRCGNVGHALGLPVGRRDRVQRLRVHHHVKRPVGAHADVGQPLERRSRRGPPHGHLHPLRRELRMPPLTPTRLSTHAQCTSLPWEWRAHPRRCRHAARARGRRGASVASWPPCWGRMRSGCSLPPQFPPPRKSRARSALPSQRTNHRRQDCPKLRQAFSSRVQQTGRCVPTPKQLALPVVGNHRPHYDPVRRGPGMPWDVTGGTGFARAQSLIRFI